LFNGPNSWTATGSVNQTSNDESGFTLLSNDLVLTVIRRAALVAPARGRSFTIRAPVSGRADRRFPSSSIIPLMKNWAPRS
jgi:hypothetical protein